jgi:hypothetical protein
MFFMALILLSGSLFIVVVIRTAASAGLHRQDPLRVLHDQPQINREM